MEIVSLVTFIVGLLAIGYGLRARKKASLITDTPTTRTDRISTAGFYEAKGTVRSDSPLSVPNWDTRCVWYHFKVEEEYKTTRDGQTRHSWRTVDERQAGTPFELEDKGGRVWVDPTGAEVEGQVHHYSQRQTPGFIEALFSSRRKTRTRVTANYLPIGTSVYVLGRVERRNGALTFVQGGEAFLISTKSEEEVLSGQESTYLWACGGGGVSLLVSMVTFLFSMLGN